MGSSQLNKSQSPFTDSESDVRLLRACRTMHLAALMQDPAADQLHQGRLSPQEEAEESEGDSGGVNVCGLTRKRSQHSLLSRK